jgi:hypothetical protein
MSDTFERRHTGEMRARIEALFQMARPWQVLNLMSRHWQEILNSGPTLEAERAEALFCASHFRWMCDELRALDTAESAEEDRKEEAGEYDVIHAGVAEIAKTYQPKPRTFPHRYDSQDGRCVYCGQIEHLPSEDCVVLRQAAESLRKSAA